MTREFQNIVYLFLLEISSWHVFTQLRKQVISFIVADRLPVGNNSVSAGWIFVKFFISDAQVYFVRLFRFRLKSEKNGILLDELLTCMIFRHEWSP